MAEFLPLCDVLFNVISLAGYFCDVVFDVVMGYALLERGYKGTFAAAISIVITSLLISQVISLRWYLHVWWGSGAERRARPPWLPLLLHCFALGVVWRYARLLVPVELRRVKHQVRDLCMLRLVHAFCEAAPMLLLQLHVLALHREQQALPAPPDTTVDEPAANAAFAELNVISAALSLFSVCWALASFSKNVRRHNVHRLLLSWLGVIFQFAWRLGTISARVCALTVYALVYEYWVFLVIVLHWVSMFLWLISPKNVFHGERISRARKAALSALIAFVYVFAYINLQELNHRQKMVTFYLVMFVENWLLVLAWWWSGRAARPAPAAALTGGAFLAGLAFMLLYYRYFHVRRLGYMLGSQQAGADGSGAPGGKGKQAGDVASVPGVFNCRFSNPVSSAADGRKKKKPTSFVPPPAPPAAFWRRPLPLAHTHHGGSSENEGSSVGSRVNIHQKLQEKKQKQLAELRVIEEEMKQGKLASAAPAAPALRPQPIPRAKTHAQPAWPRARAQPGCPTYAAGKPEYAVQNFTNQNENLNDPLKLRRINIKYDQNLTFYENPANIRNDRTPMRSPNYLMGDARTYETNGCGSPRNVLNTSPGNYPGEVANLDKPRMQVPSSNMYSEERLGAEFAPYGDAQGYGKYEAALHSALGGAGAGADAAPRGQYARAQRCRTPEILLAPHYLEGCNRQVCCHWGPPYASRKKEEGASSGDESAERDTPRAHSDIDSQISLPRSYTLPREFRYWRRRPRLRDPHLPSNNSSDGDVDSGDDESEQRSLSSAVSGAAGALYAEFPPAPRDPERRRRPAHRKQPHKPETKL